MDESYGLRYKEYTTSLNLYIPKVQLNNTGEYICFGYSSEGSNNASAILQVIGEQLLMVPGKISVLFSGLFKQTSPNGVIWDLFSFIIRAIIH